MKQLLVILNPCAGTKRAGRMLASILDIFCAAGFEPILRTTQGRGDATRLTAEYAGTADRIVCIGGDGTFNEVVTGALQSGLTPLLGYIPAGSTNDFAVSLGLSRNLLQAARDIVTGTPEEFDVGRFGDRYFTYVASFGAFTRTSYATSQRAKNAIGHLAYLLSAAASIPSIRSLHVAMTTDAEERIEGDYLFGAVGNSTSMGGVLRLDQQLVDMQDGLFELLLVKKPANAVDLGECVRALLAKDYRSRMLEVRHLRSLSVETYGGLDWTLDGEHARGGEKVCLEVLPRAMRLLVPETK